jgi:hypothetical protein
MRILPSALLAAILFTCPAVAQAVYVNVYGTITDLSGGITRAATGIAHGARATPQGGAKIDHGRREILRDE